MRRTLTVFALLALAACGQGGGGGATGSGAGAQSCALVPDAAAIFGEGTNIVSYNGPTPIASDCQFTSADGARSGGVLLFTPGSMGSLTAQAQFADLVQKWDAQTETPLEAVQQLGDEAQLAKDLPGYQTQIVVRSGDTVIAVLGSSGDTAQNGEQIARALAAQALAHASATP